MTFAGGARTLSMAWAVAVIAGWIGTPAQAQAPPPTDLAMLGCQQSPSTERIPWCTSVINRGAQANSADLITALFLRGLAYEDTGEMDRAFADYDEILRIRPMTTVAHLGRGRAADNNGDHEAAMADFNLALQLNPQYAPGYLYRGFAHARKRDYLAAILDYNQAIQLDPTLSQAYRRRGIALMHGGAPSEAFADFDHALSLDPENWLTFYFRGNAYLKVEEFDNAIADYMQVLRHDPGNPQVIAALPVALAAQAAFQDARHPTPASPGGVAAPTPALGEQPVQPGEPAPNPAGRVPGASEPAQTSAIPAEKRVALVIGNSDYGAVADLLNPGNDAEIMASSLRESGFIVFEELNLNRTSFLKALDRFAVAAEDADWAMIYFAGHGLEMGGSNYMVPIDALLRTDVDVPNQSVSADRMMAAAGSARELRLLILDACRNNPFLDAMSRSPANAPVPRGAGSAGLGVGRSTGGLAPIPVAEGGTLVAFSAAPGQIALDGDGSNSPFAAALAQRIAKPGIEINMVFRLVRDDVLAATDLRQLPYVEFSLPGRDFFFRSN